MKSYSYLSLLIAFVLLTLTALPAHAFTPYNQTEPPCEGCLGSNDPCCNNGGGGGDWNPVPGCEVCEYIPEGPEGQPGGYLCVTSDPFQHYTYNDCVDGGAYPCYTNSFCQVA